MDSRRSRRWCFTINNPTDVDVGQVYDLAVKEAIVYLIAGDEVAPGTGTPHLQGYVVFSNAWRFKRIAQKLPRAHLLAALGSSVQNRTYCSKGGHYEEFGECPLDDAGLSATNKEAWEQYKKAAREGRFDDIDPAIYIRYRSAFQAEYRDHMPRPPDIEFIDNEWWWGPTGETVSHFINVTHVTHLTMCNC